ncbi:ShlB/FhaC/HecB family hemolysin secretion/activation protein [Leptolyngbyaceae cyanobacterium CCMR0082]|uniref:ShlB/FhaC/HecB family hemolysin secretion/activation protein n=1 Tax=Adonisia turfae CCMR0082 TaxID=2304604 RepID=A0A6M0SBM9_9CYAN|nr:ShlB/FhaC/HecB family hemolysin secretion/activation protein [Adonisia turfae]NEZ65864.1 ShlB/FhaC/HecB family hemolysin secretion/activation protein [Adonisia turfae CCMR0082]
MVVGVFFKMYSISSSRHYVLSFFSFSLALSVTTSTQAQPSEVQSKTLKTSLLEQPVSLSGNFALENSSLHLEYESSNANITTLVGTNSEGFNDVGIFVSNLDSDPAEIADSVPVNVVSGATSFVCSQDDVLSVSSNQLIEYDDHENIVILEYCFSESSLYDRRNGDKKNEEFAAKLDALLTPFLGQTVLPAQIRNIQEAVTLQYLSAGYITSRAIAPQVLLDGTLLIPVIEGFIQDVRVTSQYSSEYIYDSESKPVDNEELILQELEPQSLLDNFDETTRSLESSIEPIRLGERTPLGNYIRAQLRPVIGDIPISDDMLGFEFERPVNLSDLESYVRLLALEPRFETDRTLSVLRVPELELGEDTSLEGGSILDITVQEVVWDVEASFNNYSPPSLGDLGLDWNANYFNEYGETFVVNGRLNLDEDTTGSVFSSEDRDILSDELFSSWQVSYSPPPINRGLGRLNFNVSHDQNDVVQGNFAPFGFRSDTERYSLNYRQPLIRSLRRELALEFGFSVEENQTFIGKTQPFRVGLGPDDSGVSRTSTLSFAQEYTERDSDELWLLRSQFNLGLDLFDATSNDSSIPDGQFFSWNGQAQFLKTLSNKHTLFTRASVQLTPNSLLPLNQFVMGGARSVRGYRENFRSGDNGIVFSVEDRIDFDLLGSEKLQWLDLQVIPFVDAGWIWNNDNNPNQTLDPNFIASVGIGLQANILESERLKIRLDYGVPLVDRKELDSSLQDQRLHFSISYNHHFH